MSYKIPGRISVNRNDDQAGGDSVALDIQDKINELQGKLTLKFRDQEAYQTFSRLQIKENAALIKRLRREIHEKRVLRKKCLNGDKQVIIEGFKNDKESQLAMQRFTVDKAIKEKTAQVFEKIKALNYVRHQKTKKMQRLRELVDILQDTKRHSKNIVVTECDQRSRVLLTSIEKMRLKYTSASFIQKTYQKIYRHIEDDNRKLPMRLRALEQSIQDHRDELNSEWYQIQLDARRAYDNTKFVKEKMEVKIHKEKRHRDSKLAEVRKRFKRMNQKEEEKFKPRRATTKPQGMKKERRPSISFWENIRQFWKVKRSMDILKESMCLTDPRDIAASFQRQLSRKKDMEQTVRDLTKQKDARKKELKRYQGQLAIIAEKHSAHVEATAIETVAYMNALTDVIERSENQKMTLGEVNELLVDAGLAIREIQQRLSTCDWIPKYFHRKRNVAYSIPYDVPSSNLTNISECDDIVKILYLCEEKLCTMNQVKDDDDFQIISTDFPADEVKEMLVLATASTPCNTRVCIADEDELVVEDNFFDDDDDGNDQYVSRDTIKSFVEGTANQISKTGKRQSSRE